MYTATVRMSHKGVEVPIVSDAEGENGAWRLRRCRLTFISRRRMWRTVGPTFSISSDIAHWALTDSICAHRSCQSLCYLVCISAYAYVEISLSPVVIVLAETHPEESMTRALRQTRTFN